MKKLLDNWNNATTFQPYWNRTHQVSFDSFSFFFLKNYVIKYKNVEFFVDLQFWIQKVITFKCLILVNYARLLLNCELSLLNFYSSPVKGRNSQVAVYFTCTSIYDGDDFFYARNYCSLFELQWYSERFEKHCECLGLFLLMPISDSKRLYPE